MAKLKGKDRIDVKPAVRTKEIEDCEIFLDTIFPNAGIKVQNIADDRIYFTVKDRSKLPELRGLISSADLLQERVLHAIPQRHVGAGVSLAASEGVILASAEGLGLGQGAGAGLASSPGLSLDTAPSQAMSKLDLVFSRPSSQILTSLISAELLEYCGVDKLQDDEIGQTATFRITADNALRLKAAVARIDSLQSALSDPEKLLKILSGESQPIRREDGVISDFGREFMRVKQTLDTEATVTFNYGFLMQELQRRTPDVASPPIIASAGESFFAISKQQLLRHLYQVFQCEGLIYRSEADDRRRPIAFKPEELARRVMKPEFTVLVDISQSLKDQFPEYQKMVRRTLKSIIKNTPEGQITIIPFNHTFAKEDQEPINFDSTTKQQAIEAAGKIIKGLCADGYTNLNGVLCFSLEKIRERQKTNPNQVLVVATDGAHKLLDRHIKEEGEHTEEQVFSASETARQPNEQFALISLGYGQDYNQKFFSAMEEQGGFKHCHLDSFAAIKKFEVILTESGRPKAVYEFMLAAAKEAEHSQEAAANKKRLQVASGGIAVAAFTIGTAELAMRNGAQFGAGVAEHVERKAHEPYESKRRVLGASGAVAASALSSPVAEVAPVQVASAAAAANALSSPLAEAESAPAAAAIAQQLPVVHGPHTARVADQRSMRQRVIDGTKAAVVNSVNSCAIM